MNSVIATILPGSYCASRALGVAVDEASNVVHVAYRCGGGIGGKLISIDASTNTVRSDLFVCCLGAPLYVDLNPVTDRLYLSLPGWSTRPEDATWVAVVADDLEPPTWPAGSTMTVSSSTLNSITLSWTPATDDSGRIRYRVYRDGQLAVTTSENYNAAFIGNLTPDTSYAFRVEACDPFEQCTNGPAVIGKTRSVGEAIAALLAVVGYFEQTGSLTAGQANGLEAKLATAIGHYEEGRTDQAASLLDAFINQVTAFLQSGAIPDYVGYYLLNQASLIRSYLV